MKQDFSLPWASLRRHLPKDLNSSARESRFLQRIRDEQDADFWLRIILEYVTEGLTLKGAANRAASRGGRISEAALCKRITDECTLLWLGELTAYLLKDASSGLRDRFPKDWKIYYLDSATNIEEGPTGAKYNVDYSLTWPEIAADNCSIRSFEIGSGDPRDSEYQYSPCLAGESQEFGVMGKSYDTLQKVSVAASSGANLIFEWQDSFKLCDVNEKPFDVRDWVDSANTETSEIPVVAQEKEVYLRNMTLYCVGGKRHAKHTRNRLILCSAPEGSLSAKQAMDMLNVPWWPLVSCLNGLLGRGFVPTNERFRKTWLAAKLVAAALLCERDNQAPIQTVLS